MISLGVNMPTGSALYGILQQDNKSAGAKIGIYHNTIRIGGTVASGAVTAGTACFYRQISKAEAIVDAKNNIFVNERIGGTSGIHTIYRLSAATDYSSSFLSCNGNLYNAPATTKMGLIGTSEIASYALWKSTTGYDNEKSYFSDPIFVAPDAATPDLHIRKNAITNVDKNAMTLASPLTDDFDGEIRSTQTPNDFGADAFVSETNTGLLSTRDNNQALSLYASGKQLRIVGEVKQGSTALITDLSGRILKQVKLQAGIFNIIEAENLRGGIYLLTVRDASGNYNLKFRIE